MQTFSIATGEYEGFGFRVNPVDSSIVEFHYTDGDDTVIAEFKRNGVLVNETRYPTQAVVDNTHNIVRDTASGKPAVVELVKQDVDAKEEKAKLDRYEQERIERDKARSYQAAPGAATSEPTYTLNEPGPARL